MLRAGLIIMMLVVGCGGSTPKRETIEDATESGAVPAGAEARSLLGTALFPPTLVTAERTRRKVALLDARELQRTEPGNPAHALAIGQRLIDLYRFRDAEQALSEALTLSPNSPDVLLARARARLALRDLPGAVSDLSGLAPTGDHEVQKLLGFAYFLSGGWADARAAFERAVASAKNDEQTIESVYWVSASLWRTPEQVAQGTAALASIPVLAKEKKQNAYVLLAELEAGKVKAADVEKSIGTPGLDAAVLRFGLGEWYRRQGNVEAARKQWSEAQSLPNWHAPIYIVAEADLSRLPKK